MYGLGDVWTRGLVDSAACGPEEVWTQGSVDAETM